MNDARINTSSGTMELSCYVVVLNNPLSRGDQLLAVGIKSDLDPILHVVLNLKKQTYQLS